MSSNAPPNEFPTPPPNTATPKKSPPSPRRPRDPVISRRGGTSGTPPPPLAAKATRATTAPNAALLPASDESSLRSADVYPGVPAVAPAPPLVEHQLGVSDKRVETQETSLVWVQKWLSGELGTDLISCNKSYPPSLDQVTYEHLHEDHLLPFISKFANWMASNELPKLRGEGNLNKNTKGTYFKAVKQGLFRRYPLHPRLRNGADSRWWQDILDRFGRDAHRSDQNDFSQSKENKAVPLYRDTTSDSLNDENDPFNSSDALYRARDRGKLHPINSSLNILRCQILFVI